MTTRVSPSPAQNPLTREKHTDSSSPHRLKDQETPLVGQPPSPIQPPRFPHVKAKAVSSGETNPSQAPSKTANPRTPLAQAIQKLIVTTKRAIAPLESTSRYCEDMASIIRLAPEGNFKERILARREKEASQPAAPTVTFDTNTMRATKKEAPQILESTPLLQRMAAKIQRITKTPAKQRTVEDLEALLEFQKELPLLGKKLKREAAVWRRYEPLILKEIAANRPNICAAIEGRQRIALRSMDNLENYRALKRTYRLVAPEIADPAKIAGCWDSKRANDPSNQNTTAIDNAKEMQHALSTIRDFGGEKKAETNAIKNAVRRRVAATQKRFNNLTPGTQQSLQNEPAFCRFKEVTARLIPNRNQKWTVLDCKNLLTASRDLFKGIRALEPRAGKSPAENRPKVVPTSPKRPPAPLSTPRTGKQLWLDLKAGFKKFKDTFKAGFKNFARVWKETLATLWINFSPIHAHADRVHPVNVPPQTPASHQPKPVLAHHTATTNPSRVHPEMVPG